MKEPNWIVMGVTRDVDVPVTGAKALLFADQIGFAHQACGEIAVVVSELATNVVKFGGHGAFTFAECEENGRSGIEILAEDDGPSIRDLATLVVGYDEGWLPLPDDRNDARRVLGTGLGDVHRLMDEVRLENGPDGGVRYKARKWLDGSTRESNHRPA